jgi:hypothetical protein
MDLRIQPMGMMLTLTITSAPLDLYPDSSASITLLSSRIQTGLFTDSENCRL